MYRKTNNDPPSYLPGSGAEWKSAYSKMIETLKIITVCVAAAIFYGVIHDQVTARICIEYFTVFHPPIFATNSPTLLGLGWGIIATWWVGLFLGLLLAFASRAGSRPKLSAAAQLRPIAKLLIVMACCAFAAGLMGFILARHGFLAEPEWIAPPLVSSSYPSFVADWCAHSASYASGFIGGLALCMLQYRKRVG
jgi:H+/Cl- antiporter ClcA